MNDLTLIAMPDLALATPTMYFPLGVLYLAAVVEEAGYTVEICDFREGIKDVPKSKYYGFSCLTPHINQAKALAKAVGGYTIVGGTHPTVYPEDCLNSFDYIVRGEGEEAILEILSGKVQGEILNAPRIKDLDKIPLPAYHLVDRAFSRTLFRGERYGEGEYSAPMITSRGCPQTPACSFCPNMLQTPVTFRSIENIWLEIADLKTEWGITNFRFVDDNFTIHPKFEELCKALGRMNIKFRCHTRANFMSQEKADLLKEAGCEECSLGLESADDYVLQLNNKKMTALDNGIAIWKLKEAGIRSKVYWMSGLPGETGETIARNMDFMRIYKPDKWTLSCFTPYPGCDVFENPDKYGVEILNENFDNYWNFVFEENGKKFPGREGYIHLLKGQTMEEMVNRHHKFEKYLRSEVWK